MPFPTLLSVDDWKRKTKTNPDKEAEQLLRSVYNARTIYERFDHLIHLLHHAESQPSSPNHQELASSVIDVIAHIINGKDAEEIREKIALREKIRPYDSFFMPWARPQPGDVSNDPVNLFVIHQERPSEEIQEQFNKFHSNLKRSANLLKLGGRDSEDNFWAYRSKVEEKSYSAEELEEFRILPYQSKLIKFKITGKQDERRLGFDYVSTDKLAIKAKDTFTMQDEDYKQRGIYTVHCNGSFFLGRSLAPDRTSILFDPEAILHPSYADSYSHLPMFMAGQAEIPRGEPQMIDGGSGHFKPDYEQTNQAMAFFRDLGIINNHTKIPYFALSENKRIYSDQNMIELTALIKDYISINRLDPRSVTLEYIKAHAPALHTHYQMQSLINDEWMKWQKESSVIFDYPSDRTLRLHEVVERFSKFGNYRHPEKTLALLQNVQEAINNWNQFHAISGRSSRRQEAVNNLEKRIQEQMCFYNMRLMFNERQEDIPVLYKRIVDDFLTGKTGLKEMISALQQQLHSREYGFFSTSLKREQDSAIKDILQIIVDVNGADTKRLKEINQSLEEIRLGGPKLEVAALQ
nr:hypothetical protein [Legionella jordanis]